MCGEPARSSIAFAVFQASEQVGEMPGKPLGNIRLVGCPQRLAQTLANLAIASKPFPRRQKISAHCMLAGLAPASNGVLAASLLDALRRLRFVPRAHIRRMGRTSGREVGFHVHASIISGVSAAGENEANITDRRDVPVDFAKSSNSRAVPSCRIAAQRRRRPHRFLEPACLPL